MCVCFCHPSPGGVLELEKRGSQGGQGALRKKKRREGDLIVTWLSGTLLVVCVCVSLDSRTPGDSMGVCILRSQPQDAPHHRSGTPLHASIRANAEGTGVESREINQKVVSQKWSVKKNSNTHPTKNLCEWVFWIKQKPNFHPTKSF